MNSSRVMMTNILFVLIHNMGTTCHLFWSQIPMKKTEVPCKDYDQLQMYSHYQRLWGPKNKRNKKKKKNSVPDTINLSPWPCGNSLVFWQRKIQKKLFLSKRGTETSLASLHLHARTHSTDRLDSTIPPQGLKSLQGNLGATDWILMLDLNPWRLC